jgi:hypothetical protein
LAPTVRNTLCCTWYTRDALAQHEGPVRLHRPPREHAERRGRDIQHQHGERDGRRKTEALPNGLSTGNAEGGDARDDQERHEHTHDVDAGPPQRLGVGCAAQRLQRRHVAERDEGAEREHQRHPDADEEPREDRRRLERDVDVDGEEIRHHPRQQELQAKAEQRTERRAEQPHHRGLEQVDRQHLAAGGAEAAQHGDRIDLSHHERVDAARHANAPEQQGDEPDDAEEIAELVDGLGEVELRFGGRAIANLRLLQRRLEARDERASRQGWWKLEEDLPVGAAAEQQQRRFVKILRRDVHARPDRRTDGDVARHADEGAEDDEPREAERQRVADARPERVEQRGIHERVVATLQPRPLVAGRRHDVSVERIAVRHPPDLCKARRPGALHQCHRGERRQLGHPDALAPEPVHRVHDRLREVLSRREGDVAAEEGARLLAHAPLRIAGERIDRHE